MIDISNEYLKLLKSALIQAKSIIFYSLYESILYVPVNDFQSNTGGSSFTKWKRPMCFAQGTETS